MNQNTPITAKIATMRMPPTSQPRYGRYLVSGAAGR